MHECLIPSPHTAGQLERCPCGDWWISVAVNNVFGSDPLLVWRPVARRNLVARLRIWSRYSW